MKVSEIIKEIGNLELSEKILLVEDIWDTIAQTNKQLPLPEWQKEELKRRYAEYKNDKSVLHDWKFVHEELRKKYK